VQGCGVGRGCLRRIDGKIRGRHTQWLLGLLYSGTVPEHKHGMLKRHDMRSCGLVKSEPGWLPMALKLVGASLSCNLQYMGQGAG
jgi:hypothetical protein